MKFTALFRDIGENAKHTEPWEETHEIDEVKSEEDAIEWCKKTIEWFNRTHPDPKEADREFIGLKKFYGEISYANHDWHKDCLHTLKDKRGLYDKQKCGRCGITGKRRGLRGFVERDYRYRHKDFARCDTSLKRLGMWEDFIGDEEDE